MAPNQRGTTGPAEVITDKYGFRTAPDSPVFRTTLPTILFLGDSVLFGHNVAAEKTFIEIVKRRLEGSVNIIGASAPGWDIDDYLHVIQYFVLPQHESLNIAAVIIVYCLNDITPLSASAIQQYLHSQPEQSAIKKPQVIEQLRSRMWAFKKQYNVVQFFNDIFNRHSRLFILVKRHLLDPPHGYYMYESKNYENEYLLERLHEKMMLMQKMLNVHRISLMVYIVPVAYQLRTYSEQVLFPQKKIKELLHDTGISCIDTANSLHQYAARHGISSEALFNYADPMHLSETGHAALAEKFLSDKIDACAAQ